jgi:hypothetical protein
MAPSREARVFFSGDTSLREHGGSIIGLLTHSGCASGRALTAMAVDQRRDNRSTQFPSVDWELYRRLKSEGRLNLLFHFSEPVNAWFHRVDIPVRRPNVLPFISRAEHLAWRQQWKNGRWVKLSWPHELRSAILRQDAVYRQADAR